MEIEINGSKGEKSAAQSAFDSANGFFEGAIRCAEPVRDPSDAAITVSPMSPAIANMAFAAELYLKALLMQFQIDIPRIHRLDRLLSLLPKEIQKKIRHDYASISNSSKLSLKNHMSQFSNAFEVWRYSFENTHQIRVDRLTFFAQSLYLVIRGECPSWSVSNYLDGRIRGPTPIKGFTHANLGGGFMVRVVQTP